MEEKKSSEDLTSVEESVITEPVVEEPVMEPVPEKPKLKPKPVIKSKPASKAPEVKPKKLKIINQLTQKININVLDENGREQHVEINAKQFVEWPLVPVLGGQVDTLIKKKMLKVHPFIPE